MLTEIERGMLADLVDQYGLKAVVDALARECEGRYQRLPPGDVGADREAVAWVHDAMFLRSFLNTASLSRDGTT